MTDTRKVIIKIEAETSIPFNELKQLQALVFGCVRREVGSGQKGRDARKTIKREIPKWANHDVFGTIENVEVKMVNKKKGKKKTEPAEVAAE